MSETPARNLLAVAIERQNWELAALCLVAAALEEIRSLPPDVTETMLEILAMEEERPALRCPRRRRERRR
ncbi:MAG TPA: hypothetical protein VFP63_05985 [Dehalococcoidia bacterium]|nr:hypothetical protein [Dehalococcoidia bacterium]